jgi:hypothetical protein
MCRASLHLCGNGRHQRHTRSAAVASQPVVWPAIINDVNELIRRALLTAEIPSRLEPAKLSYTDDKRPGRLSTMPWSRGNCLTWDFTCPDTLAAGHVNRAVTGPSEVANEAKRKKIEKYAELATRYQFIPIAIEALMGPIGTWPRLSGKNSVAGS